MVSNLMKGHTFKAGKKKLTYPAVAEIKLDEIRLDLRLQGDTMLFQSYADKPLHNLDGWADTFRHFFRTYGYNRMDCGVLVNRSFNDTYRYVRSSKGVPSDLLGLKIEFILFDMPGWENEFRTRCWQLDEIKSDAVTHGIPMIRPERSTVYSEEEVYAAYGAARERGFEGLMVKDMGHVYELGKRTNGWLKVKPEEDADGIITAINQAHSMEGEPLARAGSVHVVFEDGSECDAGGIAHDLGAAMLANPSQFIGQWVEVQYMERDRQGGYRHPRMHRLREDK